MLVRQKRLHLRVIQKLRHELLKHLAVLQSIPVLGESRRVPHRVVRRKPGEPAIQKIIVELFHQLAFRADAVEHLEQQGAQQLLRWDRGAARARIELSEAGAQVFQNRPNQLPYLPQRMLRRHPRLRRQIGKQSALIPKSSAHETPHRFVTKVNHLRSAKARVFSANC